MKLSQEQKNLIISSDELQKDADLDNYVSPKITAEIPTDFSIRVDDYHEFDIIKYYLKEAVGIDYEFEEVGCDGKYEAVFYIGPKPTNLIKKIKKTYEE